MLLVMQYINLRNAQEVMVGFASYKARHGLSWVDDTMPLPSTLREWELRQQVMARALLGLWHVDVNSVARIARPASLLYSKEHMVAGNHLSSSKGYSVSRPDQGHTHVSKWLYLRAARQMARQQLQLPHGRDLALHSGMPCASSGKPHVI